jgi:hypothetical protein
VNYRVGHTIQALVGALWIHVSIVPLAAIRLQVVPIAHATMDIVLLIRQVSIEIHTSIGLHALC